METEHRDCDCNDTDIQATLKGKPVLIINTASKWYVR